MESYKSFMVVKHIKNYKRNTQKFKVIIPSYNCSEYIEKCINSLINQDYENYECFIIDDCSTDNTYELVNSLIENDERFILIKNNENCGALANIVYSMKCVTVTMI